jgi:charged multivesicular body protein 7
MSLQTRILIPLRSARFGALYSDFRQLQFINPDGYNANIETWRKGLAHASRAGVLPSSSLLTLHVDESLLRSLESKEWGRPLALGIVVTEAIARKEMMGLKEFMAERESIYTKRWDLSPLSVLGWGLRQLGLFQPGNKLPVGQLVVLSNLEEAGKEFKDRIAETRGRVERIYSRRSFQEEFQNLLGEKKLLDSDFDILLKYLERDKELLVYDKDTVKLRAIGEEKMITQEDSTIASLQVLISDLGAQIEILESRVELFSKTAKEAVEKKNRTSALAALRSKKLAEATLGKRHAVLAQLEEVFTKIEQASNQVELIRVMERSTRVLAGLNKQVGGVERVDDVVDKLREQMQEVDEVGNVFAEQGREGVDEGEVDDELEAMERVEREKREAEEQKIKEDQERREAEETRRKLVELETLEKEAREKKEVAKSKADEQTEIALKKSMESLDKMRLEPPQQQPA